MCMLKKIRQEKILFLEKNILHYFQNSGRKNLPWRKNKVTPYEVWVSEVMLQQTQVRRVTDYYKKFMKRFPTIYDLSKVSWKDFLPYYAGLGYYRRGRNMLKTAQVIVEDYGGHFPRDKRQLMSLPGVGDYTASAILSFAHNDPHFAVDTNFKKVFGRFFYGSRKADVDFYYYEKMVHTDYKKFNAGVMDFANDVCAKKPKCSVCPISKQCTYSKEGGKQEITPIAFKQKFPAKEAQVFLWLHKDHKEYYSENPDAFQVFVLLAPFNTRENIKDYFRKKYHLELAVRPPYKKVFIDGKPTLFVNAQILLGKNEFGIFSKENASIL